MTAQAAPAPAWVSPSATGGASRTRRRIGRKASLLLAVVLPTVVAGSYLYGFATDQYVSEFRFSVRQQHAFRGDSASLASALGGGNPLMAVIGDSQIVVGYLESQQILSDIASKVDIKAVYARDDVDWLARMSADASAERQLRYWKTVVDPFFDMTSGIVTVKVRAFSPNDAKKVADAALLLSERLVNEISERSHRDAVAYSEQQAAISEARLKAAGVAIASYRNANAVLFPQIQATATSAVEGRINDALVEARANLSSLQTQGIALGSPQVRTLQARVAALDGELTRFQSQMTYDPSAAGGNRVAPLASVISGYSTLETEEKISEKVLERSLAALQSARDEANQQQVYLAAFVRPAAAQESIYPIRWRVIAEAALGGFAAWCLGMLLFHGIRDHAD